MADWLADHTWHCVLDAVDSHGAMTLQEVGDVLRLTRERTRQIEAKALQRMCLSAPRALGSYVALDEGDVGRIKSQVRRQLTQARRDARELSRLLAVLSDVLGVRAKHGTPISGVTLQLAVRAQVLDLYGVALPLSAIRTVGDVVHAVLAHLRASPTE